MRNEELLAAINGRFDRLDQRFAQIDTRFGQIDESIRQTRSDMRVLHEEQIKSIGIVVDGLNNANDRLARFQNELARELDEMKSFNRVAYQHLDRRINQLLRTP